MPPPSPALAVVPLPLRTPFLRNPTRKKATPKEAKPDASRDEVHSVGQGRVRALVEILRDGGGSNALHIRGLRVSRRPRRPASSTPPSTVRTGTGCAFRRWMRR